MTFPTYRCVVEVNPMTHLPKFSKIYTSDLVRAMLASIVWDIDYNGWYMRLVLLVLQCV